MFFKILFLGFMILYSLKKLVGGVGVLETSPKTWETGIGGL